MHAPKQLEHLESAWRDMHFQQALALARQAGPERFVEVLQRNLPVVKRGGAADEDLVGFDADQLTNAELRLLARDGGMLLEVNECSPTDVQRLQAGEDWRVIQAEHDARAKG